MARIEFPRPRPSMSCCLSSASRSFNGNRRASCCPRIWSWISAASAKIINTATGPGVLGNQVGNDTEFGAKVNYKVNDSLSFYGDIDHFNMALTNVFTSDASGALAPNGQIITGGADNTSVQISAPLSSR